MSLCALCHHFDPSNLDMKLMWFYKNEKFVVHESCADDMSEKVDKLGEGSPAQNKFVQEMLRRLSH